MYIIYYYSEVICCSVFRFIRTLYLVVYYLMQAGLFVYITSVLLSRLVFHGTGTENFTWSLFLTSMAINLKVANFVISFRTVNEFTFAGIGFKICLQK